MTEKEKMQKQMLYDANYDKDLLEERAKAKDLCYRFNQLCPSDEEGQGEIFRPVHERWSCERYDRTVAEAVRYPFLQ